MFGPGKQFPYSPTRKYTPCDAPKEMLAVLRDFLGFERNIIVQASCHGTDNSALNYSEGKAKGVAFVSTEVSDEELHLIHDAGVSGVRFNFVKRLVNVVPKDALLEIPY